MPQFTARIALRDSYDVVLARQRAREMARDLGFGLTDQTRIATAVSEVARRAMENQGSIALDVISDGTRRGIECACRGCGLQRPASAGPFGEIPGGPAGVERLVDDFVMENDADGEVLVMRKWLREAVAHS